MMKTVKDPIRAGRANWGMLSTSWLSMLTLVALLLVASGSAVVAQKFVKSVATGTGAGTSWDNALGASSLKTTIQAGGAVYIAAGTYLINNVSAPAGTSIVGGFPATATSTDLSGYNPATNFTIIDGALGRVFDFGSGTYLLKGVVMTNTKGGGTGGSCLRGNAGGQLYSWKLEDCIFKNTTGNGADCAVWLNTGGNTGGNLSIKNCIFDNNVIVGGAHGPALRLDNFMNATQTNDGTTFVISGCSFSNNSATGGSPGGALEIGTNRGLNFINCSFCNNYSDNYGGAITSSDGDKLVFDGCSFTGNSNGAEYGGAVRFTGSDDITINNCVFTNNQGLYSISAGGAIAIESGSPYTISNSKFYGNIAKSRGGAICFQGGGSITVSNSLFKANKVTAANVSKGGGGMYVASGAGQTIQVNNSIFDSNTVVDDAINTPNSNGGGAVLVIGGVSPSTTSTAYYNNSYNANATNLKSDIWVVGGGVFTASNSQLQPTQASFTSSYNVTTGNTFTNTTDPNVAPAPTIVCPTALVAPCLATVSPLLSGTALTNACPTTTVSLLSLTASNTPASTTLTWHTGASPSAATLVANPSSVTAGTYYAAFYDATNSCYGPVSTSVVVTISACLPPTVAINSPLANTQTSLSPTISGTATPGSVVTILGPASTTLCTTTAVSGTYACPVTLTAGPKSLTAIATNANGSSSPATVSFTATAQLTLNSTPTTLAVTQETPALGNAATALTPAGGTQPLTYSVFNPVSGSATSSATVATAHGTATIIAATGVYSYTPTAGYVGTDAIGIKICDASTPTPQCVSSVIPIMISAPVTTTAAGAQQPVLPSTPVICDYSSAPASISLTAQNVPVGYSTLYLLVNMTSGMIVQANATAPVFNGVEKGLYYAVAAHYSGALNNASAGKLISDVYSTNQCLTYGTTLGLRVCDPTCDYASAPASISFTAQNVPSGVTTTYALVDESTNLIVQTNSTASFSGVSLGDYAITSVHYTGSLTGLAAGNRLYDVTTQNVNCLSVSNTIHIRVCNSPIVITGPLNGGTVASVNPPISGTTTPGASVTVVGGPGSTGGPCITTADASGNWTCTSLTFPAGPASVTATNGSTTAVSGFTVVPPVPPTVAINSPSPTGLVSTNNVPLSGTATPGSTVVLTDANNTTLCTTTATAGGSYSCLVSLTPGSQTITATASNTAGTATATTQLTAVAPPVVAILSPANNSTATTTPTISGTTTPNAVVTLTGGPGSAGGPVSVTASPTGTYSTTAITFPTGPNSVTAVATNAGGTSAPAVDNFTVVGPPSLTVATPTTGGTTQPITGTATPGSTIAITDPSGATLCTTTASVSGTFSCPVTVPTGPSTLTVTATGPGGTTSVPVNVSAIAPPTVAILSPADNSTATTTPTISGTTAPNAVVTLTGGPGSTGGPVSVTADNNGVYSTSAITFPAGPISVTAVATNAGGTSSPAVSNFTAVAPTTVLIVRPRVFLAGDFVTSTGLMRDDLRTKSLIPLSDPYSTTSLTTNFTHTAGSAGTSIVSSVLSVTGNNAIVDWVFVQLHDPTSASTVVMTRAGLLQRDGDIVDLDGTSPLSFTANPGSFYLSVRHRNHLGVMTLNTVALSSTVVTVDFTNPATATYGTYAQRVVLPTSPNSVTVTALWPGNANSNKNVIYQGSGNDLGMILSQIYMASSNTSQDKTFILSQYLTGDLNLDGNVIYQGSGNELGIVLGTVLLFPDNITATKIYIVSEQLP